MAPRAWGADGHVLIHVAGRQLTPERILTILAEAPPRIAEVTAGLSPAQLRTAPNPDGWSANDVLAHVRSCADVWGSCIARMIAEDRPTLRAFNPRTWINRTNYPELEFHPSFRSFAKQRAGLVAILEPLPPKDWSRSATVTGAGSVLERTVLIYAQWLARHERTHLKQFERVASAVALSRR